MRDGPRKLGFAASQNRVSEDRPHVPPCPLHVRFDSKGYDNTAFVAAHFGFDVQIDELGRPDGAPRHRTGAIYDEPAQAFSLVPAAAAGSWNRYQIRVEGQGYTVSLNGVQVTRFENPHQGRGLPAPAYVGVQTHTGRVAFRNIRIRPL